MVGVKDQAWWTSGQQAKGGKNEWASEISKNAEEFGRWQ
jgi:hypothetical protein